MNMIIFSLLFFSTYDFTHCDVFGSVFEVDRPHLADYIIYEESAETFADVIVFEQKNRFYASKQGMWYFEKDQSFARYKVYFTDQPKEADFKVYFTRFESFAGCNQ
jgi:outer membrane lipoprotein-sorting protein